MNRDQRWQVKRRKEERWGRKPGTWSSGFLLFRLLPGLLRDTQSSQSVPRRRVFITLPPLQQEGRHISRLQSTANGEKQRTLIPVNTAGLGMDKLSLQKSWTTPLQKSERQPLLCMWLRFGTFGCGRFISAPLINRFSLVFLQLYLAWLWGAI